MSMSTHNISDGREKFNTNEREWMHWTEKCKTILKLKVQGKGFQ